MGKGLIVYQSKYGATKKYAMWLAETAGFDVTETAKAENRMLEQYDRLVCAAESMRQVSQGFLS